MVLTAAQQAQQGRIIISHDPDVILRFAKETPWADIPALQKWVLSYGDGNDAFRFARDVTAARGADIEALQQVVLKEGDFEDCLYFATTIPGANQSMIRDHLVACVADGSLGDHYLDEFDSQVRKAGSMVKVSIARDASEYADVRLPESIVSDPEKMALVADYVDGNESLGSEFSDSVRKELDEACFFQDDGPSRTNYRMITAIRESDGEQLFDVMDIPPVHEVRVAKERLNNRIEIREFGIVIENGMITHTQHNVCDPEWNAAVDGITSLALAHHMAGIDVTSAPYIDGLRTAFDAIVNHFGLMGNEDRDDALIPSSGQSGKHQPK